MKTRYVKDLQLNEMLGGETFAVVEAAIATDKNDRPYYNVTLADKTGQISGKIWSDHIPYTDKSALKTGKLVAIDAQVGEYKGKLQLTITAARGVDETQLEDYIESSMFDPEEMWNELLEILATVKNPHLQKLFENMFSDSELVRKLKYWPAAVSVHHDFRSGMLQHLLEMMTIAEGLDRFYPNADMDIVKAGVLLHDIGKLDELDASGVVAVYSLEGSLVGHIALGLEVLGRYLPEGFPTNLHTQLKHIILSHHGSREFGSPVLPSTQEAIMVHYIDDLSAKSRTVEKGLREPTDDIGLTGYNRWLETRLYATPSPTQGDTEVAG